MATYRNSKPRPIGSSQNQSRIPTTHRLLIATAESILLLSEKGVRPILNSPSGGILAVKEAKNGSGNIALADGQIIIIQNIEKVAGKTFKLHAEKVCTTSITII